MANGQVGVWVQPSPRCWPSGWRACAVQALQAAIVHPVDQTGIGREPRENLGATRFQEVVRREVECRRDPSDQLAPRSLVLRTPEYP